MDNKTANQKKEQQHWINLTILILRGNKKNGIAISS